MELQELELLNQLKLIAGDIEIDHISHKLISYHIRTKKADDVILDCIKTISSCREFVRDTNIHVLQTTSHGYKFAFAEIAYIYETYPQQITLNLEDIVNKCKEEHNTNLEWEKENPIIDYNLLRKLKANKTANKKSTSKNKESKPKISKEEKRAIKLQAVAEQLKRSNATFTLSFNLKSK